MPVVDRKAWRTRLRELVGSFPAVLLCGSRQCGKSTLARRTLRGWRFLDMERRADRDLVTADPDAFLAANPKQVVFDEAQAAPALFPALRHAIDSGRSKGRYLLLGSVSPGLVRAVSESLAGRVGILELAPFLASELPVRGPDRWFWGGYPPVRARRSHRARHDWFDAYLATFVERDLPAIGLRLLPQRVRTLLQMLSHVHGNLLNSSDLARSLGVTVPTVQSHLDVLEGAFLIRRLQPHFANVQKRLTKSPKLYLRDTGLLHYLAGLRGPGHLAAWPGRGRSFEGLVVEELVQQLSLCSSGPYFAFWRTQAGAEVDLLFDIGRGLVPVEIKSGTVDRGGIAGLRHCMQDLRLRRGYVVSAAVDEVWQLSEDITVLPWAKVARGELPREWRV